MPDPAQIARQLAHGSEAYDDRDRSAARGHFRVVDRYQFVNGDADRAADAYVDALWAKDRLEKAAGPAGLEFADWSPVVTALIDRCDAVGIADTYATSTAAAWRRHKVGGDYWTPILRAQMHEVRAIVGGDYPRKDRGGAWGFGALPFLYGVGVEAHDVRAWDIAIGAMTLYFERLDTLRD